MYLSVRGTGCGRALTELIGHRIHRASRAKWREGSLTMAQISPLSDGPKSGRGVANRTESLFRSPSVRSGDQVAVSGSHE